MRHFQIQACVLFDRPYQQDELFEEPLPFSEDTAAPEAQGGDEEPLIGYYTTRLVAAQAVAEAVHYVEEDLTTDEDMPHGRIYDIGCTEVRVEDLEPEIREEMKNSPDVPGIFHEGAYGFFSEIEIERPHYHEH
jgi:molybdopterin-guanine dinucleotide biosynthesis protein A